MKIRLMGTEAECATGLAALHATPGLEIVQVDGPYPNRPPSALVRYYLETRPAETVHNGGDRR